MRKWCVILLAEFWPKDSYELLLCPWVNFQTAIKCEQNYRSSHCRCSRHTIVSRSDRLLLKTSAVIFPFKETEWCSFFKGKWCSIQWKQNGSQMTPAECEIIWYRLNKNLNKRLNNVEESQEPSTFLYLTYVQIYHVILYFLWKLFRMH